MLQARRGPRSQEQDRTAGDQLTGEPKPLATVYVPTLKGGAPLAGCLDSLLRQSVAIEIVVADNGPGDGCQSLLEERFPGVSRVAFGENLGFGTAVNRAVATCGSGPIVLLNDDAIADPRFVESLINAWGNGKASMVAGVMLATDGRIDSAGVMADETLLGRDHLQGEPVSALRTAADPLGPTGGGALYDREAFSAVNGFDEKIFLYYEDLDLALRIREQGGKCRLAEGARARHEYSATLGARSARKYRHTGYSRGYLLGRYRICRRPTALARVLVVEGLVGLGQLLSTGSPAGLQGRLRGWRRGRALPARELSGENLEPAGVIAALKQKRKRSAQ